VEVGDLQGADVLDLGCGLGHMCDFLQKRALAVSYRGVDVLPRIVAEARRLHPGVPFEVVDAIHGPLPWDADFVFVSGVLNLETGANEADMRRMLRAALGACRRAAAVNMLSTWADRYDRGRHYYDPGRALRSARRLTPWVVLRHDYMPHDFTLYLYRKKP
jgi:trans-aconitate methyltransferase